MSDGFNGENQLSKGGKLSTYEWLSSSIDLLAKLGVLEPGKDKSILEFEHPAALKVKFVKRKQKLNQHSTVSSFIFKCRVPVTGGVVELRFWVSATFPVMSTGGFSPGSTPPIVDLRRQQCLGHKRVLRLT